MSERMIQKVEQEMFREPAEASSPTTASIVLELGSIAMRFARVERVPRYDEKTRESDVEHSFMLALVANELAYTLYPTELDRGLVIEYTLVHDFIELKTGDTPTFNIDTDSLLEKEATEHAALESLLAELPPHTRDLLYNYEQQKDKESRFVRAVDKLLPIGVDILGPGRKVMNEDYGVHSHSQLASAHDVLRERMNERFGEFPQLVIDHSLLCELFEIDFSATQ